MNAATATAVTASALRKSSRKQRPHLDKQLSENSSLLSADLADNASERVRFDDNVSFMDETKSESIVPEETDEELLAVEQNNVTLLTVGGGNGNGNDAEENNKVKIIKIIGVDDKNNPV